MIDPRSLNFGQKRIGHGEQVFVIAEIGINHEGDFAACARLTEAAATAGADAIKLQTVDPDENYAAGTESHELFSRALLTRDETARIFDLARSLGLEPFTTAGDRQTVEWIERLSPAGYKISSGLLTTTPLVHFVASKRRPVILSTGMAELKDIERALEVVASAGCEDVALLQCTSLYPAPEDTLNLAAIRLLHDLFGLPVGFSDHSLGVTAAPLAVGAGAAIIEKHITLDTNRPGFDHGISLDPDAFKQMVGAIRIAERMMGAAEKRPTEAERGNAARYHRRLATRRAVSAGASLQADDIGFLRFPVGAGGMAPDDYWRVLGRRSARTLGKFEPISEADLDPE
ncbi:MAG TPA: N-acetylneuraminate synthase family protein [Methyloceanibacter sp.]|nr:N-acetylneuraminate synthase family protein [Methyloceanibacter sp.]